MPGKDSGYGGKDGGYGSSKDSGYGGKGGSYGGGKDGPYGGGYGGGKDSGYGGKGGGYGGGYGGDSYGSGKGGGGGGYAGGMCGGSPYGGGMGGKMAGGGKMSTKGDPTFSTVLTKCSPLPVGAIVLGTGCYTDTSEFQHRDREVAKRLARIHEDVNLTESRQAAGKALGMRFPPYKRLGALCALVWCAMPMGGSSSAVCVVNNDCAASGGSFCSTFFTKHCGGKTNAWMCSGYDTCEAPRPPKLFNLCCKNSCCWEEPAAPTPAQLLKTDWDDKCLDYDHQDREGNVHMRDCDGHVNQKWFFHGMALKAGQNNKCLDYNYNTMNVYMQDCNGHSNQKWSFKGTYLTTERDDKCLVYNYDSGNIDMGECHAGNNTQWHFASIPVPVPSQTPSTSGDGVDITNILMIVGVGTGGLCVLCCAIFICCCCRSTRYPAAPPPASAAPVVRPAVPASTAAPAPATHVPPAVVIGPIPEWAEKSMVPGHWTHQDIGENFNEWCEVPQKFGAQLQKLLDATWKGKKTRDRTGQMPTGLRLVKAHRVENRDLWQKYKVARDQLAQKRPNGVKPVNMLDGDPLKGFVKTSEDLDPDYLERLVTPLNELYLWHGTSPDGAVGISKTGFRFSHAGAHGLMFGLGAYMAECSSKSDEYATDSGGLYKGMYALLLCRVACGEMFRVTQADNRKIDTAMATGEYDSVLGDREASAGTYREFVVPAEDRIYPEYVVIYERICAPS